MLPSSGCANVVIGFDKPMALAIELAKQLAVSDHSSSNVASLIAEAFWYVDAVQDLGNVDRVSSYVSQLLQITVFDTDT